MAGAVPIEVPQFRQRHVVPGETHAHPARGAALMSVTIAAMTQRF